MSETSIGPLVAAGDDIVAPNYFTYYTCAVKELLSQDDDFLPFKDELNGNIIDNVRGNGAVGKGSGSVFSNNVGAGFSDHKMERLNALLRKAIAVLTPEVDEMLEPVVAMRRLQSQVKSKKSSESDASEGPNKKLKISSSSSSIPSPVSSGSCKEGDDDLQFLLESDDSLVEETVKKYSNELVATLGHMESKLEELLDAVVSTCRSMARFEKQQLQKMIRKLPPKNLKRVVEIVESSKPGGMQNSDEIFINLEQEDNITLWRLYYYVEAVEKARKLAS